MEQVLKKIFSFYRLAISPYTPGKCRYEPTCSRYSEQAFTAYGPFKGTFLTLKRLVKCNPFVDGGYDPITKKNYRHN